MAESTLGITYPDLLQSVGRFLGYDLTYNNWTEGERYDVDQSIKAGLNQFYNPPPLDQNRPTGHRWTFLDPVTTLATVSGTHEYDLPDDYAGVNGDMYYQGASDSLAHVIRHAGLAAVLRARQQATTGNAKPSIFAVKTVEPGNVGTRNKLILYPTPDAAYTITYQYTVIPNMLDANNPYPHGSSNHSETIRRSCLAAADHLVNSNLGVEYQMFIEALKSSVQRDSAHAPTNFGYNGNNDSPLVGPKQTMVTVYGVQY